LETRGIRATGKRFIIGSIGVKIAAERLPDSRGDAVQKPTPGALTGLALAALVAMTAPARGQLLSKWGHPVFTVGGTPYDSVNQGHGALYPGGPGFIPGYGYYPGPGPGRYPWIDGPGTPFDRRTLARPFAALPPAAVDAPAGPAAAAPEVLHPPAPVETAPPGAALVIVKLPEEAELFFDGARTGQGGSYRRFVTPSLSPGGEQHYTLEARWHIKGVELTRREKVQVQPGAVVTANFLSTNGWTGTRDR
jgi:uncharacterized protein (TIGR03000 family)